MKTAKTNKPDREKKKTKSATKMLVAGLAFALLTLLWVLLHLPPNPEKASPQEVAKYIASKAFAKLPRKDRDDYLQRFQDKNGDMRKLMANSKDMSMSERRNLFHSAMSMHHQEMKKKIAKIYAADKEERNKLLDEMIAEENKRHQEMAARGGGRGGGPGGPPDDSRMQGMLENSDSTSRAQMHEIHKLINQRRQETNQPRG